MSQIDLAAVDAGEQEGQQQSACSKGDDGGNDIPSSVTLLLV